MRAALLSILIACPIAGCETQGLDQGFVADDYVYSERRVSGTHAEGVARVEGFIAQNVAPRLQRDWAIVKYRSKDSLNLLRHQSVDAPVLANRFVSDLVNGVYPAATQEEVTTIELRRSPINGRRTTFGEKTPYQMAMGWGQVWVEVTVRDYAIELEAKDGSRIEPGLRRHQVCLQEFEDSLLCL